MTVGDGTDMAEVGTVAIGASVALAGLGMIALGVRALGLARTLFVYEYSSTEREVVVKGIYRVLRHPLFLGGVAVSFGLAICSGDTSAVELALVNLAAVPFYVRLEDRRCYTIFGPAYADYREAVGGLMPRTWLAIRDLPFAHQLRGRRDPMIGRSQVKKP
jgi:protein-S-isoprenylcysteine O-methyltransferase